MKLMKNATIFCILLAAGAGSQSAWAERMHGHRNGHGRSHVGVHIGVRHAHFAVGGPVVGGHGRYGYYPYYFAPFVIAPFVFGLNYQYDHYDRYAPYPVYPRYPVSAEYPPASGFTSGDAPQAAGGERDNAEQPGLDRYHSYYCHKPEGYYPFIKTCPAGWQKIDPPPPTARP